MTKPYMYHASGTRLTYGLRDDTTLYPDNLQYRLIVGENPVAPVGREFGGAYNAWSAYRGAELAAGEIRSPLDTRRLEVTLIEVVGGERLRTLVWNPNEDDLRRAEEWRDRIEREK